MVWRSFFLLANRGLLKQIERDQDLNRVLEKCDQLIDALFKSQLEINEARGRTTIIKDPKGKITQIPSDQLQKEQEKTRLGIVLDDTAEELKRISRDFRR